MAHITPAGFFEDAPPLITNFGEQWELSTLQGRLQGTLIGDLPFFPATFLAESVFLTHKEPQTTDEEKEAQDILKQFIISHQSNLTELLTADAYQTFKFTNPVENIYNVGQNDFTIIEKYAIIETSKKLPYLLCVTSTALTNDSSTLESIRSVMKSTDFS